MQEVKRAIEVLNNPSVHDSEETRLACETLKSALLGTTTNITPPNCYECKGRCDVPGDAHSSCSQLQAHVEGSPHGIRKGWFLWPWNFDPTWLVSCDSFIPLSNHPKPDNRQA
jgi:hypothetical protein